MTIACDASVLKNLGKSDYESYGRTLISFAEKMSLSPFLFFMGSGGSIRQLRKRIVHIACYQKLSAKKRLPGTVIFVLTAVILSGFVPMLSTCAADANRYQWNRISKTIHQADLSAHFEGYEGSFVLYGREKDCWTVYISGWFIGFVENSGNTSFFAVNIGAEEDASGFLLLLLRIFLLTGFLFLLILSSLILHM